MPKQQITIEVDVPEGKQIAHKRCFEKGVCKASVFAGWHEFAVLFWFEDDWEWPEWLKADWIAMDEMGQWHGYREEPTEALASWAYDGPRLFLATWLNFTPPPCTDWRQSKRRRPGS